MKLNKNNSSNKFITSDDILMTGQTIGKDLTEVVNSHDKDINDLKQYTKWLYVNGGTGSKGGGSSNTTPVNTLSATVKIGNTVLTPNKNQQIVLNGEETITISGGLSNTSVSNGYYISIKKNTDYITKSISRNGVKYDKITSDTWYQFSYDTNVNDNISLSITIVSEGNDGINQISYSATIIKEAYIFGLSFCNNNFDPIISTDNDLWIDGMASVRETGLMLDIEYNVIAENKIKYKLSGEGITNMFNEEYINGYINENKERKSSLYIPFKDEFIFNDDSIGYYTITIEFEIAESGQAVQTIYKQISFNLIPQDSYYVKTVPYYQNQKFYKYNNESSLEFERKYNEYDLIYTAYQKLYINNESLDNKEEIISYIRSNYDENILDTISDGDLKDKIYNVVNNFEKNIYIYSTGSIAFNITAYHGSDSSSYVPILCELDGEEVSIGITQIELRTSEKIVLNVVNPGVHTFSVYVNEPNSKKIVYYMYVYNKSTEIDWYEPTVILQAQNYWRNSSATYHFNKYNNVSYIQKYSNDNNKTNVVTLSKIGSALSNIGYPDSPNDILISIGIQYSSNNVNIDNPIIEILSKENTDVSNIKIYQNKIETNNESIKIFLPKESLYNVKDPLKYHLLTIYKRFLYNNGSKNIYEFNIYLDGTLENAANSFVSSSSPITTINLLPGNFGINLLELSYFTHNDDYDANGMQLNNLKRFEDDGTVNNISYLDDIAISEYYYKYISMAGGEANNAAFSTVKKIVKSLKGFEEVSSGLIKVNGQDVINDIGKEGTVPVMLFEHTDASKGEFVKFYTSSKGSENAGTHLKLESLKYSNGNDDLKQILMPSIEGQGNIDQICNWYIELQGSSTLLNFAKNLNVGIEQGLPGYMVIFTPNFKYVDFNNPNISASEKTAAKNTYLPETKFTLKTDQVDSSHSNNTAVGAFVNANTTPFRSNTSDNYSNYIKNCLLGFPVLVFIKVNEFKTGNESAKSSYYFLGIMNFNLGRDSYFNMGYYDSAALSNGDCNNHLMQLDGHTFTTTYIQLEDPTKTSLDINKNVLVAEIQGGDNHFDFSQSDESVLFPQYSSDGHVMFGDFVPKYTPKGNSTKDKQIRAHLQRLVESVSLSGGYLFDMIGKHFGEYEYGYNKYIDDGYNDSIFASANQVPNYMIQYQRLPGMGVNGEPLWTVKTIRPQRDQNRKLQDLRNLILNYTDNDTGETNTAILDYKSISEYYNVCMAFGLVDSVMKNLNVKTWTANDNVDNGTLIGTWYAAFYDMDTAFGRNNSGQSTSYFAFSDYWFNSKDTLSSATIYRDFFPKKINDSFSNETVTNIGYDIPSSYLFAIAKYAPMAFANTGAGDSTDEFESLRAHTPQNIWARWRSTNENNDTIAALGSIGFGELRNADYFIDKYFIRNLDEIPEQIWNMNYRLKYLKRIKEDPTLENGDFYTYDTVSGSYELDLNKKPFHGKGINELREWLSGRLHILDAYFNIDGYGKASQYPILKLTYKDKYDGNYNEYNNATSNFVQKYNSENNQTYTYWEDHGTPEINNDGAYNWIYSGYYDNMPDDNINSLYLNEDIILLSDIFSRMRLGNKYDNNVNIRFKAKQYSPILTVNSMGASAKYLIEKPNNEYEINISKVGSQNSMIGGSENFTWVKNLNSLITSEGIYVKSNNLESITLSQGQCENYTFLTPALKDIIINPAVDDEYSYFGGNLDFNIVNGEDSYPCLSNINISNTNIQLSVNGEGVKSVNASRINTPTLSLLDCNNLSSVNLTNAVITTCTIMPGWSNNIEITNSKITNLKIGTKNNNDSVRKFKLTNDINIRSLELSNFTEIEIRKCNNLSSLKINNVENITSLIIEECNLRNANTSLEDSYFNITFNSASDSYVANTGVLDFSQFVNLKHISLKNTLGITSLDFSNIEGETYTDRNGATYKGINLLSNAFDSTDVKTIITSNDQVLFINGPATFRNTGYVYGNNTLYIKYKEGGMSLGGMFANSYFYLISNNISSYSTITNAMVASILNNRNVQDFKKTIYEDITNIVDISNMFEGQTGITVSKDLNNYSSSLKDITLSKFTNVRNISHIYAYSSVYTIDSTLFELNGSSLGQNVGSINIDGFVYTSNLNCEIHTFKPIIDKLTIFLLGGYATYMVTTLNLFDSVNKDINAEFEFRDLFESNNGVKQLPNLKEISCIQISNPIDWRNAFITDDDKFMMPNLEHVYRSLSRNIENVANDNINEWGFNRIDHLITVEFSLNFWLEKPILYSNVINLDVPDYKNMIPTGEGSSFNMNKYIYENDFITLLKNINTNEVKDLSYQFRNIIIVKDPNDPDKNIFKTYDNTVTSPYGFTKMQNTFESMKLCDDIDNLHYIPIKFTGDSLKYFINVSNWDYTFMGITLLSNFPLNMFNRKTQGSDYVYTNYTNGTPIKSMEGTFKNVKIDSIETYFKHEDYPAICIGSELNPIYNNGQILEGSYNYVVKISNLISNGNQLDHEALLQDIYVHNPKSKNAKYDNQNNVIINDEGVEIGYGYDLKNHLILPFDILWGCTEGANIKECFANSDFEGILPSLLLQKTKTSVINKTFNNLLIIPNRIYNQYGKDYIYSETELMYNIELTPTFADNYKSIFIKSSSDNILNNGLDVWYQRHKTYLFVPYDFTNCTTLNNAFTFKLILPQSSAKDTEDNAHNGIYEYYFILSDKSVGTINSLSNGLPGENGSIYGHTPDSLGIGDYEFPAINRQYLSNNSITEGLGDMLNSRAYHNIHISTMLRENEIDNNNQNFSEENTESLTREITQYIVQQNQITEQSEITTIDFGVSYKYIGIPLSFNLRNTRLSNFVNPLLLKFLFSHIFKYDAELGLNNKTEYSGDAVFNGVSDISRYAALPQMSVPYFNALSANIYYSTYMSYYNAQGTTSYEYYSDSEKYNGLHPINLDQS